MNQPEFRQAVQDISGTDLEQRRNWYSPAAQAYDSVRPRYPRELVSQAIEKARLSRSSRILEIGSGPGTASVAFAGLGCRMVCLEPNPDFYRLARRNCRSHPSVEILNIALEEWSLEEEAFDAVLAASSMHWIPSDLGYALASRALKRDGRLILLWNKELQPCDSMRDPLARIYERHAPSAWRNEDRKTQEKILHQLGEMALESGEFQDMLSSTMESQVTYTSDQYIDLLSTYSSHLRLMDHTRNRLFSALRTCLSDHGSGEIRLFHLSACQIFRKRSVASRPPEIPWGPPA